MSPCGAVEGADGAVPGGQDPAQEPSVTRYLLVAHDLLVALVVCNRPIRTAVQALAA